MTKSEARAVFEGTSRALRAMEGVEMPWAEMSAAVRIKVNTNLKSATDEIRRVHELAGAELEGKR